MMDNSASPDSQIKKSTSQLPDRRFIEQELFGLSSEVRVKFDFTFHESRRPRNDRNQISTASSMFISLPNQAVYIVLPDQLAGLVVDERRDRAVVLLHQLAQTVVGVGRRAGRNEAAAIVAGVGRAAVARDEAAPRRGGGAR